MPSLAVLGGSVIGSAAALLFARAGWDVTLVDPELPVLEELRGDVVRRPGAPHTAQAHAHTARASHELRTRLPDVYAALLDAGAHEHRFTPPPPLAPHGARPVDDSLTALRCRRVLVDREIARAVRAEPGITRRAVAATELLLDTTSTVPRAVGLALADGTSVAADLVVDAGGRRSPVGRWLAAAGIVPREETLDCGLTYYTRHYRIVGDPPPMPGFALVIDLPGTQVLGFLGDGDHLAVAMVRHTTDGDRAALAREDGFEAALADVEELDEWRRVLVPDSPVMPMGTVRNRMISLVEDGRPVVTGLHPLGDALVTTNPSRGRGIALGLAAVGHLADLVLAENPTPSTAEGLTLELAAWNDDVLRHYFRETCIVDLEVERRIQAHLTGGEPPSTAPDVLLPADHPVTSDEIAVAAMRDPDLFRTFIAALHMMDDDRRIASAETAELVRELLATSPEAPLTPA